MGCSYTSLFQHNSSSSFKFIFRRSIWRTILTFYLLLASNAMTLKGLKLGDKFRLMCFPKEKPELNDRSFEWMINGTVLKSDGRITFRKSNSVLRMKDSSSRDVGVYSCQEVIGETRKEIIVYKVAFDAEDQDELQFTKLQSMNLQKHVVMPPGDELKLRCKATGKPPISYTWYKNKDVFLIRRVDSSLVTNQAELVLKDLVPSDSGLYKCIVSNNIKTIQHNFSLIVQESRRMNPYLEKEKIKNQTVFVGSNTTIPCFELISGKLPDFRWLRWKSQVNEVVLDTIASGTSRFDQSVVDVLLAERYKQVSKKSHRSHDHTPLYGVELVFTNVTMADEGFYTCLLTNHIGHDYKTMYLTVLNSNAIPNGNTMIEKSSPSDNETMMIIIAILGIIVFICFLVLAWLFFQSYFKNRKGSHKHETSLADVKIIKIDPPNKNTCAFRMTNVSSGGSGAILPLLNGCSVRSNSE